MLCQESCRFRMLFSKPFDGFFRSGTQKPKRLPLAWLAEQHVFFGTFVFVSPPCLMARDHKSSTFILRVPKGPTVDQSHNSALARSLEDILLLSWKGTERFEEDPSRSSFLFSLTNQFKHSLIENPPGD